MGDVTFGDRELDVMAVLWELGSGTVSEVRERLSAKLAYTTVLTILQRLEAKEFISHEDEGRAHRYYPRVARRTARRSALARLVDGLFQGSHEALWRTSSRIVRSAATSCAGWRGACGRTARTSGANADCRPGPACAHSDLPR